MPSYVFSIDTIRILNQKADRDHSDSDWLTITWSIGNTITKNVTTFNRTHHIGNTIHGGDVIQGPFTSDPISLGEHDVLSVTYVVVNLGSDDDLAHEAEDAGKVADKVVQTVAPIVGAVVSTLYSGNPGTGYEIGSKIAAGFDTVINAGQDFFDWLHIGRPNCNGEVLHDTIGYTANELKQAANRPATRPPYEGPQENTRCGEAPHTQITFSIRQAPVRQSGWFIQSSGGNFEAVVLEGRNLFHYWHDNTHMASPWQRGGLISTQATGRGSLIQSSFGNFEVVVPEGANLVHYWLDTAHLETGWHRGAVISKHATGPGALIQSSFGTPGNFEVVVLEGNFVTHYWHDNANMASAWQRGGTVANLATGPASLMESSFGNLEAVVLEGTSLVHNWMNRNAQQFPWQTVNVVSTHATGPGSLIQSTYGNFEVAVLEGRSLVHYWHEAADMTTPWHRGKVIS